MPAFQSNPFRSSKTQETLGDRIADAYRKRLARHPFALFGLPFIGMILGASFLLTPATALRYEKHDRKNRELSHAEAMELGLKGGMKGEGTIQYNPRRRQILADKNTERDEYYRLMAKDLDNWEQKRVQRWKGCGGFGVAGLEYIRVAVIVRHGIFTSRSVTEMELVRLICGLVQRWLSDTDVNTHAWASDGAPRDWQSMHVAGAGDEMSQVKVGPKTIEHAAHKAGRHGENIEGPIDIPSLGNDYCRPRPSGGLGKVKSPNCAAE